jgi:hypothetical protein
MDGCSCNIFEFVEVIGLPRDSSLLLLLVQSEGFCLSLWWIAPHTCASLVQSLVFMGLMTEGTLHHYNFFIWEMVDFITKGHEMGSPVLTQPCHHISFVVVLRSIRVTPCAR